MYLLKARGGQVKERPQHMLMRVSAWINSSRGEAVNVKRTLETYELMSQRYYTHATPTLFNAGTRMPQLSSCMLLNQIDTPERDSIDGMYDLVKHVAQISKMAGGIGTNCTLVRSRGSYIHGSGGTSKGLVPFLRVLNETARHVDQAGVRKGAVAVFMEPWHADIFEFLDIRKNAGVEEARARDLFTALWVPDEFFRRVLADEDWALMCPNDARGLADACGDDFVRLYREYEGLGIARRTVKARQLWDAILRSMIETGTPYISAKDAVNAKSGQKNLGTIRSSNLCNEVTLYSDRDETAVCVLASVALSRFVKYVDGPGSETYMDYAELHSVTMTVARNLDAVIDTTIYPTPECEASSKRHRPIGIGVQGFCDVLYALRLPFESAGAREVNVRIFETMYHAAVLASVELAEVHGPYSSFRGLPRQPGLAPVRPVGRCADQARVRLGEVEGEGEGERPAQQHPHGAHAHREHVSAPPEHGVVRAAHVLHVQPQDAVGGVHGDQPLAAARPDPCPALDPRAEAGPGARRGLHPGHRAHPAPAPGALQDDLGGAHEGLHRHDAGPGAVRVPEREPEPVPEGAQHEEAQQHAPVRLEGGPEDDLLLPQDPPGVHGDQVHGREREEWRSHRGEGGGGGSARVQYGGGMRVVLRVATSDRQ